MMFDEKLKEIEEKNLETVLEEKEQLLTLFVLQTQDSLSRE
jgi:hypothetical protein